MLTAHGADVEAKNGSQETPVMFACFFGFLPIVQVRPYEAHIFSICLQTNPFVSLREQKSQCFHIVRCFSLKVLIAQGADIEARDNNQHTSLMLASVYGHLPVVKVRPDDITCHL